MDIVLRESDRLNETIRSFLSFARPQRTAVADLDVRQILTDAARLLQNSAEVTAAHSIVVAVPDTPVMYRADEAQIRQIVWNLATNGLRAMPAGGQLRLRVQARPGARGRDAEVIVGIDDEGVGIAPEDIDRMFQPFRGGVAHRPRPRLSILPPVSSGLRGAGC